MTVHGTQKPPSRVSTAYIQPEKRNPFRTSGGCYTISLTIPLQKWKKVEEF